MRPSFPRLALLTAFALLLTGAHGAGAQTAMPLPPLANHTSSTAQSINDRGEVAGTSFGGGNGSRAVVWNSEGMIIRVLPPLEGDVESSFAFSSSNVINNHGQVVGTSIASDGTRTPVVWDHRGMPKALSLLPGDDGGEAYAISAHGRIVGESSTICCVAVVVWDQKGRPTEITSGFPDVFTPVGGSINSRTEVAGSVSDREEDPGIAVEWDRNGVLRELSPLEVDQSCGASAINDRGQVAGNCHDDDAWTAVVWDPKGRPAALPPLPGDEESLASGINGRGQIVGQSLDSSGNELAVIWDREGTPTALPALFGSPRCTAEGINARGHVVGRCIVSSDPFTAIAVLWR